MRHDLAVHKAFGAPRSLLPGRERGSLLGQTARARNELLPRSLSREGRTPQGEITPAYAILPRPVIAECRHFFPELRLIYIIRNPLDRAWSHANIDARVSGLDTATLPDARFLEHFRSAESLTRGDYETCLRNRLAEYSEEQLLILFFEELALSQASFLAKCCRHLDLANIYGGEQPSTRQRIFEGPSGRIRPSLHAALRQMYSRKVSTLGTFLKKDLSAWLT